ncbi:MAG: hypothetical protein ABI977_27950 [Acidobacteriota bacterium]
MRSPFYQASFCAECGNRIEPRSHFSRCYFCDDCAAQLKQRRLITPLAGLLLIVSLAVFAFSYKCGNTRNHQLPSNSVSPVSAQDSIVNTKSKPRTESTSRVLCGARTRKGTPCRHLVQPGQRCAQHRGLPSLLDEPTGKTASPDSTTVTR